MARRCKRPVVVLDPGQMLLASLSFKAGFDRGYDLGKIAGQTKVKEAIQDKLEEF